MPSIRYILAAVLALGFFATSPRAEDAPKPEAETPEAAREALAKAGAGLRTDRFDSTAVVQEVQDSIDSFGYVKGTHFQSSFGHLIGYDAGYYSYQWALALSRDVLTRFQKEGLMNKATAAAWRYEVLEKGGSADPNALVMAFLGRKRSLDAYFSFVRGDK